MLLEKFNLQWEMRDWKYKIENINCKFTLETLIAGE